MKTQSVTTELVKIADLVLDKDVQLRESINQTAVLDYAEAMENGDEFPAIVVFYRFGSKKYVADGFHRVLATKKVGAKTILAEVRDGTKRDAILYAAGANLLHGVRRSNADKRKAVFTMLRDKEWVAWADAEIARRCGVSASMVARWRELLGKDHAERQYVNRNGELRYYTAERKPEASRPARAAEKPRERCPYCGQWMDGSGIFTGKSGGGRQGLN